MSLISNVTSRYSNARISSLTNPDQVGGTGAIDTVRLEAAVADVEADFEVHCGVAYDDDNAIHVSVCVQGVVLKLEQYLANADPSALQDRWAEMLKNAAKVLGRNRVMPTTTSNLTPTAPTSADGVVRPTFDNSRFPHINVGEPGSVDSDVDSLE